MGVRCRTSWDARKPLLQVLRLQADLEQVAGAFVDCVGGVADSAAQRLPQQKAELLQLADALSTTLEANCATAVQRIKVCPERARSDVSWLPDLLPRRMVVLRGSQWALLVTSFEGSPSSFHGLRDEVVVQSRVGG